MTIALRTTDTAERGIPNDKILRVSTLEHFRKTVGQGYLTGILERNLETLATTKQAFIGLMKHIDEINTQAFVSTEGKPLYRLPKTANPDWDKAIRSEVDSMLLAIQEITGDSAMRIEIRKTLSKDNHDHSFSVLNANWGGCWHWRSN